MPAMSLDAAPLPSASAISVTATSGLHVVRLSGYSHAKLLLGAGEFVESAAFKAAGHYWRVRVYPNGAFKERGAGSIALYLVLAGEPKADVNAQFQFSLLRHGSKLTLTHDGGRTTNLPVTFNATMRCWGFDNLAEEPDHDHLKDDTILIRCDITVLKERHDRLRTHDLLRDCNGGTTVQETPLQPSASTIAVTASTGCHVVKVSGYAQTKLLPGNGCHINSAKFKEAGHTWRIWCYPDGDREETAGHISLYLELAGRSTHVQAEYQFSLVPHGQLTSAPDGGGARSDRHTFLSWYTGNNCHGFKDFMAREELEESEYLKDDCFYVRCDITALNKPVVELRDPETMELLCCCNDDLCKNIHTRDKTEAEPCGKPRRCLGLKRLLLSCLPIPAKSSQRPVFADVEYSRL